MNRQKTPSWDWYSISATALRRWGIFATLVLVAGAGYFGYHHWQRARLQTEAVRVIARASSLLEEIDLRGGEHHDERRDARELLEQARVAYDAQSFGESLSLGERSLRLLRSILEIESSGEEGTIRFLSVSGSVELRRGERGAWKRARARDRLRPGDWVKTGSDGTAEIVFGDGALYTLRPDTMVDLGGEGGGAADGGEPAGATGIVFGWVELNTSQAGRTLSTPASEARVGSDSEALVSYDESRKLGRFAAFEGSMQVISAGGESRELSALEQLEQTGDLLGEVRALPQRPEVVTPEPDQQFDFDTEDRLELAWRPVPGAARYALRVSTSRLFASSFIEVDDRSRTTATLGVRGEGSFHWQVAAIQRNGLRGPWSEPQAFRVASLRGASLEDDQTPPELELRESDQYGSVLILSGKTEPGAAVTIAGESVSVEVDGTFKKTIQLTQEGSGFLEVVATDAAGNETRVEKRFFVDAL